MSCLGARVKVRPRMSGQSVRFQRDGKQLHHLHEINAPARLCTWPDLYVSAVANELHGPRLAH